MEAAAPLQEDGAGEQGLLQGVPGESLKRKREEGDAAVAEEEEAEADRPKAAAGAAAGDGAAGRARYKKRKVALFVSYCGRGYQGMQKNIGARTIEGDLEEALFKAGAIAESTYGHPRKIDWARAARTDKGVSAVGQVVSGRFFIDPPGFVERVNAHLAKQIRLLGFKRVTGGFSAKKLCDRRRYEYVLPLVCLDPTSHRCEVDISRSNKAAEGDADEQKMIAGDDDEQKVEEQMKVAGDDEQKVEEQMKAAGDDDEQKKVADNDEQKAAESESKVAEPKASEPGKKVADHDEQKKAAEGPFSCPCEETSFTFDDEQRAKLQDQAGGPQHAEVHPVLRSQGGVQCSRPGVCPLHGGGAELHAPPNPQDDRPRRCCYAGPRTRVHHRVRLSKVSKQRSVVGSMAPELGLFLDECLYSAYNQRYGSTHEEVSLRDFEKENAEFKAEVIYPHIASTDAREGVFARWLHVVREERYPDFALERKRAFLR